MKTPFDPVRPDGCISDLRFDTWLSGELAGEAASQLARHVADCDRCRTRHEQMLRVRQRFLAAPVPALPTPNGRRLRPSGRGLPLAAVVISAAAALALMAWPKERVQRGDRAKGFEQIGVFVKRGEQVRRGHDGDSVQSGDRLRFTYTSDREGYLALVGRDGAGTTQVYFPTGKQAIRVAAGRDQPLPIAVELDGTPGKENFVLVFCEDPFALAPLSEELARQGAVSSRPGCFSASMTLVKSAP